MNTMFFSLLIPLAVVIASNRLYSRMYYLLKTMGYILLAIIIIYLYLLKQIDSLSLIYGLSSTYVSIFVSLYSREYVDRKNYPKHTVLLIDLFIFLMITAFISPNIVSLALTWSIAELIACELVSIGVKHSLEGYTKASTLFLFLSTLTFELSIFTIIYTFVYSYTPISVEGTIDTLYRVSFTPFQDLSQTKISIPVYLLVLAIIGFITKSAQIPLHFWLVGAHTGAPSPVSALLSGVTTAMGIYGLLRVSMFLEIPIPMIYGLATISIISIIYSGLQAYVQRDGKQLLAYSTILGNGFSILLFTYYCYTKSIDIHSIILISVLAHMGYKSTLFLDIGLVEEIYGFRYLHRIHGLNNIIPYSTMGSLIAIFSLLGIPPTTGFTSKLFTIIYSLRDLYEPLALTILLVTIIYMVFTIPIALNYVRIHFGSPLSDLITPSEKKVNLTQQLFVFTNSLSNMVFILALLVETYMYSMYVFIILTFSPLLIILLYLLTIVMKRE